MAILWFGPLVFAIAYLLLLCHQYCKEKRERAPQFPFNWPILGRMPGLFCNGHRIHDYVTELLQESGYTFEFRGPWLANLDMLITGDPANIHYILSIHYSNFQKGSEFKKYFDILGEGIFNAESESSEKQRKTLMPLVNQLEFHKFAGMTSWKKLEKGLIPVLEQAAESGMEMDLQELFDKFTFDTSCIIALGHDPYSLGTDLPEKQYRQAFDNVEEAVFHRHVVPGWLQIGVEKKHSKAQATLNEFLATCISLKSEKLKIKEPTGTSKEEGGGLDFLTGYMKTVRGGGQEAGGSVIVSQKVWEDVLLNLILAGKDTISAGLSFVFWLLATNPKAENKVLHEIESSLHMKEGTWQFTDMEDIKKLVYLHGALCESLRLFPPVALQHKAPVMADILPSDHRIDPNTKTLLSFYSMGRMEKIRGNDCLEFKPQRWISEHGSIRHEPSFKFTAFNAGPKNLLGQGRVFHPNENCCCSHHQPFPVSSLRR